MVTWPSSHYLQDDSHSLDYLEGAHTNISCRLLVLEIGRSHSVQGKLLKHNLGPEVVDALKDLRRKLSEKTST